MIDRTHPLSLTRQAAALGISRGAVYYVPRAASAADAVAAAYARGENDEFVAPTVIGNVIALPSPL